MEKFSKTLRRTATLEGLANRFGRESLREIVEAYTSMLQEMLGYALEHNESQSTLYRCNQYWLEISIHRWEGHDVPLDRAPWGVGEAVDSAPRANSLTELEIIK